jgi:hypothetical protein
MLNNDGYTPLDMTIQEGNSEKAKFLVNKIKKYHPNCNIKYIKKANRLDLKFEKAITLALMKNNLELMNYFPNKCMKTVLVSMS